MSLTTVAELRSTLGVGTLYPDATLQSVCDATDVILLPMLWNNYQFNSHQSNTTTEGTLYFDTNIENVFYVGQSVVITGNGSACVVSFQAAELKTGQRLYTNSGNASMGYDLPAAIGASIALGRKKVICLAGDGSLMMNLHDLQTISDLRLPINIFVVNNGGYGMIRQTQNDWKEFLSQGIGCNFKIPDIKKLSEAFGLKYTDKLSREPSIFEIKMVAGSNRKDSPAEKITKDYQ
jgi:thiamine pyrophosphate-dependent acetolactate synthase large subunit-like protein